MLNDIKHITIDNKEYPLAFTLNVMESVQEKYGSIEKWADKLEPKAYKNKETGEMITPEPNIKDLIWTFKEFINEGIDIENEEKGENREMLTHKQVGRLLTKAGVNNVTGMLMNLAVEATNTGEEKN